MSGHLFMLPTDFLCQHRSSTCTPLILAHYISRLHLPVQLIVPNSMCAPHSGELTFNYKSKFWTRVVRVLIWIRSCAIRFEITVRSIICSLGWVVHVPPLIFQGRLSPYIHPSGLLGRIGGGTCSPLSDWIVNHFVFSDIKTWVVHVRLFEICLNYWMLIRMGSTCTTSYISMLKISIFLVIMPNRWYVYSPSDWIVNHFYFYWKQQTIRIWVVHVLLWNIALFEICLNYRMLIRGGRTWTTSYI